MIANNPAISIPVTAPEFEAWMSAIGYFEPSPYIAIATSGGADSMALLLLARNWAATKNARVISLTVNHNLRLESADEALQVKNWCKNLGIEHHTLNWEYDSPPISGIQEAARNARYKLMAGWCRETNILHLLTAHHLDDQTETLFFRLVRASHLEGLSSISAQKITLGIRLLRPLLQVPKSRLTATLDEAGQKWIEDPSNQNPLYSRVHIRKQLAHVNDINDTGEKVSNIISRLANIRKSLEFNSVSQMTKCIGIHPEGYGTINTIIFKQFSKETATKSLSSLTQTLSGLYYPPRSEKMEKLANLIQLGQLKSKYTVGGLVFEMLGKEQSIIIYREKNALEKPVLIQENTPVLWDKRFIVEYITSITPSSKIELRALGSDGYAHIKKNAPYLLNNMPPARIIRTFPSLWILEELINVPHIRYMNNNNSYLDCESMFSSVKFCPAKPLAGSSFFVMNNPIIFK